MHKGSDIIERFRFPLREILRDLRRAYIHWLQCYFDVTGQAKCLDLVNVHLNLSNKNNET